MNPASNPQERARWAVLWVKDGRVIRKNFGADLSGAIQLYGKAAAAEKRGLTLLCCNMGFAPPEELQPRIVTGMRRGVKVTGKLVPLKKLNEKGIWYCPYCMKLRRFVKKAGFYLDGVWVPDARIACPMCGISHNDHHVRKWNPSAHFISSRVTDPNRKRRRRRANQES